NNKTFPEVLQAVNKVAGRKGRGISYFVNEPEDMVIRGRNRKIANQISQVVQSLGGPQRAIAKDIRTRETHSYGNPIFQEISEEELQLLADHYRPHVSI